MAYTFNSSTWEAKESRSLRVTGQSNIHIKFQASQQYIVRPCLKKKKLGREGETEGGMEGGTDGRREKNLMSYICISQA